MLPLWNGEGNQSAVSQLDNSSHVMPGQLDISWFVFICSFYWSLKWYQKIFKDCLIRFPEHLLFFRKQSLNIVIVQGASVSPACLKYLGCLCFNTLGAFLYSCGAHALHGSRGISLAEQISDSGLLQSERCTSCCFCVLVGIRGRNCRTTTLSFCLPNSWV